MKKQIIIYVSMILMSVMGSKFLFGDENRPNFLIIMVDDLSPEEFGCYGNKENKTPNIDQLAKGGVKFNTAWATPMCSPTRTLLVTGLYPSKTGIWHNSFRLNSTRESAHDWASSYLTFPRVLRDHGYKTAIAGNPMELGGKITSEEVGFDEYCVRGMSLRNLPKGFTFTGQFEGKYNFPNAKPVPSRYWHPCVIRNGELMETKAEDFGPDIFTDFLIDFMKRQKDQPFLAYYPMNLVHDIAGHGLPTTPIEGIPGTNKGGSIDGMVEYIDVLIGRMLKSLEEAGLRENTVVIFTSDNGDSGSKKMHANEDGPRVPFIVNCPSIVKVRGSTSELMEFSDIYPTLMEFSASQLPEGYQVDGKSMVPFLTGSSDTHRDWITSYIATSRMVRTRNYLLESVDPIFGDEQGSLSYCGNFHLRSDYNKMDDSPESQTIRNKLLALLDNNPWPDVNDPKVVAEIKRYSTLPIRHFINRKVVKEPKIGND